MPFTGSSGCWGLGDWEGAGCLSHGFKVGLGHLNKMMKSICGFRLDTLVDQPLWYLTADSGP